jgi:hypothetical protein
MPDCLETSSRKPGWCLTNKLPVFDRTGAVIGV